MQLFSEAARIERTLERSTNNDVKVSPNETLKKCVLRTHVSYG